jgi:transcriptional regulator with XRE-family HTH domain
MNLKKQIKLYLDEKSITASELARNSGVPKQSISDWLAGSNPRDIRQVKKVADVFNVSVDHLVFGDGPIRNDDLHLQTIKIDDWVEGVFEVKFRKMKDNT